MRFLILASFFLSTSTSTLDAQPASAPLVSTTVIASADLRADLATLRTAFLALHPGLYRYTTPRELAAKFDSVDRYFSTDRTLAEAYLALTRLTAAIKCGHTYLNFYNQSDAVAGALFGNRDKVPFEFRWIDGRMIITADRSAGGRLPRGTEVLAVNGVDSRRILERLMPLARADGSNDGKRISYLEVAGIDGYEAFDVLYPLVFPVTDTLFTLDVRRPGARRPTSIRVPSLTLAERRSTRRMSDADPADPVWDYSERDGVGVLTMPTWALYNSKWDWKRWTDSLMTVISARGVRDLVLDIRANEGGQDVGDRILAHLISDPLPLPRYRQVVRYQSVPSELRSTLRTWDKSFFDWGTSAEGPDSAGFYRLRKWDDDSTGARVVQPNGPRFTGSVWVLVGPVNSSATFQFAQAVKSAGVATLVGRTTGGNYRGLNGSAYFFTHLPRTGLEVDLPLVASISPVPQPDAGVEPDIVVRTTASDIARGIDVEMQAVLERIRARRAVQ